MKGLELCTQHGGESMLSSLFMPSAEGGGMEEFYE